MVEKKIPKCGHKVKAECGKKLSKNDCISMCEKTLDCGHPCPLPCREPCTTNSCQQEVELESAYLPCGHSLKGKCCLRYAGNSAAILQRLLVFTLLQIFSDQDIIQAKMMEAIQCSSSCQHRLVCDHRCSAKCHECQTNRFHSVCVKRCNKILICGHKYVILLTNELI